VRKPEGKSLLVDLGVDGRIIKLQNGIEDVDWIDLAQDRDAWRSLVSTVMKFSCSMKYDEFLN
jgi:hypothetical protein